MLDPEQLKSNPEQNRLTACQQFFVSKKNPCGGPFTPPHGFVFLSVRAVAFRESTQRRPGTYPAAQMPLSLESDESESRQWLSAGIRGQIQFRVCTHDVCNRLAQVFVYRGCQKGVDLLPACGPASTVAMPEICPRSLILLAEITKRWELSGNSVLRSVITPFCQMKPWDQLLPELKELPTTWPRLLMLVAKEATSPGRRSPRLVTVLFCQRAAKGVPSELTACPTIWPWLLMAKAMAPGSPRSGSGMAVPFSHNTA